MTVLIREAEPADLPPMQRVESRCFGRDSFTPEMMSYLIEKECFHTWVAFSGDRMVGYASLMDRSGLPETRLLSIAVVPEERLKGVGRSLLSKVLEFSREREKKVTLEVRLSNVPAINMYLRSGFRVIGIIAGYYCDDSGEEDALYMEHP
ncbi:MAG: GNAT family N-acetyltransferase [Methanomassiliicoccales archaeon]